MKDLFFVYCPENGFDCFLTLDAALDEANERIQGYLGGAWSEEVTGVCAGKITHRAQMCDQVFPDGEIDEEGYDESGDYWDPDCEYKCDYRMLPVEQSPASVVQGEPVAYISHTSEGDILGWELQIDAPNHTTPYTAPKPVEQQSIKSDLARDAADHLTNWLEMDICECEDGHYCGYNEVKRTRDALLEAAEQQPSPGAPGLAEVLEGILPYVVDEPWECRGDKCRELRCISCFGDDEACESAAKAKQAIHKAVSALAVYRNQGGDK